MEQEQLFIDYIERSIVQNWDKNALTDYQGITLQYKDVARKIAKFHIVLESAGIRPGDKIAVCGRNSAHWAVCFLATVTYGAVIVPILHEFKADNIHNIVNHSEAKLLFVGDRAWESFTCQCRRKHFRLLFYKCGTADGFHSGRLPGRTTHGSIRTP